MIKNNGKGILRAVKYKDTEAYVIYNFTMYEDKDTGMWKIGHIGGVLILGMDKDIPQGLREKILKNVRIKLHHSQDDIEGSISWLARKHIAKLILQELRIDPIWLTDPPVE